ncbi:hypothetical protein BACCELL_03606 [Bacteroides cellulosilyticus DSM 14838]|uniref:Uncharacterized protein n=1 Tax=Bacteroides cellulosilyticus DSM 14838 TaxID=537012 RepID=E2NH31_9BACE|nr:hypothetical protein BACCELL_03606 [Bacteroides cellulosilyticus DSM 14838]
MRYEKPSDRISGGFFFIPVSHFLRLQLPLCNFIPTFAKINWKD